MEEKKSTIKKYAWGAIILVLILWGGSFIGLLLYNGFTEGSEWTQRGQFGDMFGAVNSLFSGLAFGGVVIAIFLQRKDLKITQEEIELQKEQLKQQNDALQKQIESINKQNFENTFMNMMSHFTSNILPRYHPYDISGNRLLKGKMFYYVDEIISDINYELPYNDQMQRLSDSVEGIIIKYHEDIDIYCDNLLQILIFINESDLLNKLLYVNYFRSQFTKYDLIFLFYLCFSKSANSSLKDFIEKYQLLKKIDPKYIIDKELVLKFKSSAFGKTWDELSSMEYLGFEGVSKTWQGHKEIVYPSRGTYVGST